MAEPEPQEAQSPGDLPDPREFLDGDVSNDGVMPDLPSPDLPVLEFKEARPEPTEPQQSLSEADLLTEIKELREQVALTEQRRADTERSFHERNQESLFQKRVNEAMEARLQMERQAAEAARGLKLPELSADDLMEPDRVTKYLADSMGILEARIAASLKPAFDSMSRSSQTNQALMASAKRDALRQGRKEVESLGYDDFNEYRGAIEEKFDEMDDGELVMVQPGAIRDTYLLLRARAGKPMSTPASTPKVPVTGARPNLVQERNERLERIKRGYGGLLESVLPRLGITELDASNDEQLDILEKGLR